MKFKQRKNYEGFEVPSNKIYHIACCDCGLVHDFVFVSEDGKPIGIAARTNKKVTLKHRRTKSFKFARAVRGERGGEEGK